MGELTYESLRNPSETLTRSVCPPWCAVGHGTTAGEEDWLHLSEPLRIAEGVSAQLCMTIDPMTLDQDGPYVLIGTAEYTLSEATELCSSLMALIAKGSQSSR